MRLYYCQWTREKGKYNILFSLIQPETIKEEGEEEPAGRQIVEEHKKKLETNAFYKLENTNSDRLRAQADLPRLEKLIEIKEKDKDFFEWNQLLRKRNRE